MSIEHVTETTCPRCLMPYAIHEGDEVTTVCPNILKKMETVPSWLPVSLHQGRREVSDDIERAARALAQHLQLAIDQWSPPRGADADDDHILSSMEKALDDYAALAKNAGGGDVGATDNCHNEAERKIVNEAIRYEAERANAAKRARAPTPPASHGEREEFTRRALKFVDAYKAYADAIGSGLPRKGTDVVWADKEQHAKCVDLLIAHDALLAAERNDPRRGEAKCGWCGGQGYVEGSVNLRPYRIECVRCHPVATGPEIPMGGPVRIIDATPRAGASEGEVIEPLRCPASRDEVDSYLREVAFHDSTLPEPTDAMIDRVWAICRETRTLGTVAVLAVRMWEAEENIRRALRPTPPPAEGVVAKRRAALDAPTAGGGEGVDDGPVVKATSLPHRGIFGPYERHDGTMSDATPPPATGEAGAREAEIRKNERERCAKAARQAALVDYGTANQFDALCQQRDKCADAIEVRALPEAREGGGKMANRIFATYGERRVELRLCHRIGPDYSGPVWAVIVDSEGGPERFVELEEAKAHAEARVGVPLTWDATSR